MTYTGGGSAGGGGDNIGATPPALPMASALPTLGYGVASSPDALPAAVSAIPLIVPNLAAVVVMFLPLLNDEPAVEPVLEYVRAVLRHGRVGEILLMEALIAGPFLLAIPLAVWTARLALAPRPRSAERWIAWSLTLVALTMTLFCLVYCVADTHRLDFLPAVALTLLVIALGSTGVAMLRRLRNAWPAALLAMTGAWAANTTLTMFVLLSHAAWTVGIGAGLIVVAAQLVLAFTCVRRWRAAMMAA